MFETSQRMKRVIAFVVSSSKLVRAFSLTVGKINVFLKITAVLKHLLYSSFQILTVNWRILVLEVLCLKVTSLMRANTLVSCSLTRDHCGCFHNLRPVWPGKPSVGDVWEFNKSLWGRSQTAPVKSNNSKRFVEKKSDSRARGSMGKLAV